MLTKMATVFSSSQASASNQGDSLQQENYDQFQQQANYSQQGYYDEQGSWHDTPQQQGYHHSDNYDQQRYYNQQDNYDQQRYYNQQDNYYQQGYYAEQGYFDQHGNWVDQSGQVGYGEQSGYNCLNGHYDQTQQMGYYGSQGNFYYPSQQQTNYKEEAHPESSEYSQRGDLQGARLPQTGQGGYFRSPQLSGPAVASGNPASPRSTVTERGKPTSEKVVNRVYNESNFSSFKKYTSPFSALGTSEGNTLATQNVTTHPKFICAPPNYVHRDDGRPTSLHMCTRCRRTHVHCKCIEVKPRGLRTAAPNFFQKEDTSDEVKRCNRTCCGASRSALEEWKTRLRIPNLLFPFSKKTPENQSLDFNSFYGLKRPLKAAMKATPRQPYPTPLIYKKEMKITKTGKPVFCDTVSYRLADHTEIVEERKLGHKIGETLFCASPVPQHLTVVEKSCPTTPRKPGMHRVYKSLYTNNYPFRQPDLTKMSTKFLCQRFKYPEPNLTVGSQLEGAQVYRHIIPVGTQGFEEYVRVPVDVYNMYQEARRQEAGIADFRSASQNATTREGMDVPPREDVDRTLQEDMDRTLQEDMDRTLNEMDGTPKEEMDGTPKEEMAGTPKEEMDGIPKEEMDGIPKEEMDGTPKEEMDGTPKEEMDGTPKEEMDGILREGIDETPREAMTSVRTQNFTAKSEVEALHSTVGILKQKSTSSRYSPVQSRATFSDDLRSLKTVTSEFAELTLPRDEPNEKIVEMYRYDSKKDGNKSGGNDKTSVSSSDDTPLDDGSASIHSEESTVSQLQTVVNNAVQTDATDTEGFSTPMGNRSQSFDDSPPKQPPQVSATTKRLLPLKSVPPKAQRKNSKISQKTTCDNSPRPSDRGSQDSSAQVSSARDSSAYDLPAHGSSANDSQESADSYPKWHSATDGEIPLSDILITEVETPSKEGR